ncbi:hypothetical protein MMC31_000398 [Peltigera leucophlebia]|nr:hypothetical protein [Peltigera leucophlebia]
MPRVTRAALRSQVLLDEVDLAISTPLPSTPRTRVPLGEIAANTEEIKNLNLELSKTKKKQPVKGKRKVAKKTKKQTSSKVEDQDVEVLEDDNQSTTSSAVDEACQSLMQELPGVGADQVVMHDQQPHTPASPAVSAVNIQINSTQTPKFDPKIHGSQNKKTPNPKDCKEDSFLEAIDSRSPAKMTCVEPTNGISPSQEPLGDLTKDKDGSFIEQIMKRTPVRQGSRIEDSVEAIDAFEEAIEKVGELIPAMTEEPRLGGRTRKQRGVTKASDLTQEATKALAAARKLPSTGPIAAKTKRPTERVKMPTRKPVSPPTSVTESKAASDNASEAGPITSTTSSVAGTTRPVRKPPAKRVSSITKVPFQPTKSTKPPTRSTFELPGEAIARKLKEQREERLKRTEEDPDKKTAFKTRPVRKSSTPIVKATATSRARLSLAAKLDTSDSSINDQQSSASKPKTKRVAAKAPLPSSTEALNKRLSVFSANKPTEEATKRLSSTLTPLTISKQRNTPANTSARLVRAASTSISNTTAATTAPRRASTMIMGPPPAPPRPASSIIIVPAPAELAQQKLRGKEVFNRVRVEQDERDRIKREKEEAAKKARAEAAERGRLASREWAERQRLKKMGSAATLVAGIGEVVGEKS